MIDRPRLLLSLQRALLGNVHADLRQASIDADPQASLILVRFEYDGPPSAASHESCKDATTEVIADFGPGWALQEEHLTVASPARLKALAYVAYRRWEPVDSGTASD